MNDILHTSNGLRGCSGWGSLHDHDWIIWNDADWSNSFEYVMGGSDCAIILSTESTTMIFIKPIINLHVHYRNISCGVIIMMGSHGLRMIRVFVDRLKPSKFVVHNERLRFMHVSGLYLSGVPPPGLVTISSKTIKRPARGNSCLRSFCHLGFIKERI